MPDNTESDPSSTDSDSEIQRGKEWQEKLRASRSVSTGRQQKVTDGLKITEGLKATIKTAKETVKDARKALKDAKEADKPAAMAQLKDDIKMDYSHYLRVSGNNPELARSSLLADYKTKEVFWDPQDGDFDPSKHDRRKGVDWPRDDLGKKLILNKGIRDDIGDKVTEWLEDKYQKTASEYSMEKKKAEKEAGKDKKSKKDQQKEDSKRRKEEEKTAFDGWNINNKRPNFQIGDYVVSRDNTQAKLKGKQGMVKGISRCNNVFEMLNGSDKLTLQFVSRFKRDRTRNSRSGSQREAKVADVVMSTGLGPREESKATDVEMSTEPGLAR
jgi:hypothetical protein